MPLCGVEVGGKAGVEGGVGNPVWGVCGDGFVCPCLWCVDM